MQDRLVLRRYGSLVEINKISIRNGRNGLVDNYSMKYFIRIFIQNYRIEIYNMI